jgi:hypothetical protein
LLVPKVIKIQAFYNVLRSKESEPTVGVWGALGGS